MSEYQFQQNPFAERAPIEQYESPVVVIAGSRSLIDSDEYSYDDLVAIIESVCTEHDISPRTVVSGGARGPDTAGEQFAKKHGIGVAGASGMGDPAGFLNPFAVSDSDWDEHGKVAGIMRNEAMARAADSCIALWDGESSGTGAMIDMAHTHCNGRVVVEQLD